MRRQESDRPRRSAAARVGGTPSQEQVAQVAYALFERRGGSHGFDRQDWFEAERIVQQHGAKPRTVRRPSAGRSA